MLKVSEKNYYLILGVPPNATLAEIKRSFRFLANKFHPDKNQGDARAEEAFKEIAEAYDVLSDAAKRQQYHERKFSSVNYGSNKNGSISLETIFQEANQLEAFVAMADPFRINRKALFLSIENLLSPRKLLLLEKEKNSLLAEKFSEQILLVSKPLNYRMSKSVIEKLHPLFEGSTAFQQKTTQYLKLKKRKEDWDNFKPWIAMLLAFILCVLIFFVCR